MASITTRAGKGSPLTNAELDANFNNINAQLSTAVITGGTIDGATIGATTATTGKFSQLDVDNLRLDGNTISSTDTNGNVTIAPNGTGIATFSKATVVSTTDNTNAALRITQLGTGNALLVEDSTNPDSTPFVIDNSGYLVVGHTSRLTTTNTGQIESVVTSAGNAFNAIRFSSGTGGAEFNFAKSDSDTVGTNTVVASADTLGTLSWSGADGTNYIRAAQIFAAVDGTPGTNDMPGRLIFSTTADGASTPTERMRIDSTGNVGIGSTSLTGRRLVLSGTVTGSTTSYGEYAAVTFQSDVTTHGYGVRSQNSTQATAFTLTNLSHFGASQGTVGAGSTVTNQYGFNADSSLIGATNNYGFYGNIASGTGRYNFYAAGTADNYFAGQVQLGAGTAAAPALSTTGDTNTGIFFPAADTIAFAEGGAEAMRIDSSGRVGIGTTSPTGFLNVDGTGGDALPATSGSTQSAGLITRLQQGGAIGSVMDIGGNGGSGSWIQVTEASNLATNYSLLLNPNGGNVLAGTTSSDITAVGIRLMGNNQLQTSKSGDWSLRTGRRDSTGIIQEIYYNSSRVGDIATNGTGTTYNSASDYRLKENIQPMTGALARNALLNPVKYKWKVDGSDGEGFIADQLQGPFPSAVTGEKDAVDADGNPIYQSIGTGPLDGHFAACVNELQTIIQEQHALITALTTRITALEAA